MSSKTTWNASRLAWMSAMIANFMQLLSYDFKPAKFIFCFSPTDVFFLYKMLKTGIPDALTKGFQFIFAAFGEQLDPAIRQIPHRTGNFVSIGRRLHTIPKADTLHCAPV